MKYIKILLIVVCILFMFLLVKTSFAQSTINITSPLGNEEVLPESDDYATLQFSDPWDMSNAADSGLLFHSFRNIYMRSGKWYGSTNNSYAALWPQFNGYPGSYPNGREGEVNKIHSGVYKRITIKMYLSKGPGRARLWWFRNQQMTDKEWFNFNVKEGWNIYQIDLPANKWYG